MGFAPAARAAATMAAASSGVIGECPGFGQPPDSAAALSRAASILAKASASGRLFALAVLRPDPPPTPSPRGATELESKLIVAFGSATPDEPEPNAMVAFGSPECEVLGVNAIV